MQTHPFVQTRNHLIIVMGIILTAILWQWGILYYYCNTEVFAALTDSIISVGTFATLSYFLWYAIGFLQVIQADILITAIAMIVWLAGCFSGQLAGETISGYNYPPFLTTLPLRLLFGIMGWTIVLQWYRMQKLQNWKADRIAAEQAQAMQSEEITDRITVKDGTRIHLIQLVNLIYIQASGDYVMLQTNTGQYLKEQTMKYFESHLSASRFVRIHRSYIVNVEYIQRVELFGKETYQVLLKNGNTLRASSSGYKQLKTMLSL